MIARKRASEMGWCAQYGGGEVMSESNELRNMGLKATFPRLKVLDLFQHSKQRHLSAEDVYKLLLHDNAEIGLATVYRVLTQFEQAGLLSRHHFESGKAVFELNEGNHHDHIVCVNCGHVEEFNDPEIEKRQEKVAKQLGFVIKDHHMILYAEHCPHCPRAVK
jgi:Fur family ferric uptake transcriptional regulator